MSTFDEREKSYEAKYAYDQETNFKINARRNRLFGEWAAEQLGLSGSEAEAYAKQVIAADFDKPGDEDVFAKVWADLQEKGVEISEHRVRKRMSDLLEVAREQIVSQ
ncbi:MAG TPA: DUF1476 domain-containing protein [Alphaproteobacteria bacterium]|nr:DUF1476 domain-containing protein [Alphaproteobacteria bacterium]